MGMPCVPTNMATELMDSSNCISLQTINIEELSLTQFQTLITVPFSEILVIEETSQLKPILTSASLVVSDFPALPTHQLIGNNNFVVYVPPELAVPSEEVQMAQQWYEDSVVATQAMEFLSQIPPQTSDGIIVEKPNMAENDSDILDE